MSRLIAAAVSCAVLAGGAVASATVVIPADFRKIVADAVLIVRGRVTDVRAITVAGRGVESVATVAVEHALKGEPSAFVSVRVPGGTIGRYRVVMIGAPVVRAGERAVFFLARSPDGAWRPVGLASGVVAVEQEAATGRAIVRPPLVAGRTTTATRVIRGDARRKSLAVAEFESLIRLVMAGRSAGGAVPR